MGGFQADTELNIIHLIYGADNFTLDKDKKHVFESRRLLVVELVGTTELGGVGCATIFGRFQHFICNSCANLSKSEGLCQYLYVLSNATCRYIFSITIIH